MANTADREIVVTRTINAPRELVFKAWTDPEHLAHWWSPPGFTSTVHTMDVRPGGVSRVVMRGPDGVDYDNVMVYVEVAPPDRLVYDYGTRENDPDPVRTTITLQDEAGKTKFTMTLLMSSAEKRDAMSKFAEAGASAALARLDSYLSKQ